MVSAVFTVPLAPSSQAADTRQAVAAEKPIPTITMRVEIPAQELDRVSAEARKLAGHAHRSWRG
ncbi:hypothetical protein Q5762_10920 [Streptomyces sp. P9(2023)]|uniref:hypothetical protein n=1 Tax=Streptomyces sp. P9(2023) TaxID=3064394 RepID=UPI0028F4189A|nr:hypothetical protein [Streptomyces sp. P9(2023)]MDT9688860.1 hypothetical protein [Streptomyces sp. P9(2023)]